VYVFLKAVKHAMQPKDSIPRVYDSAIIEWSMGLVTGRLISVLYMRARVGFISKSGSLRVLSFIFGHLRMMHFHYEELCRSFGLYSRSTCFSADSERFTLQ
jgi:hypothetical protein